MLNGHNYTFKNILQLNNNSELMNSLLIRCEILKRCGFNIQKLGNHSELMNSLLSSYESELLRFDCHKLNSN